MCDQLLRILVCSKSTAVILTPISPEGLGRATRGVYQKHKSRWWEDTAVTK